MNAQWIPHPGDKVKIRVAPGATDWTADHRDVIYTVVGVYLARNPTLGLRTWLSEDWPKDGGFDDVALADIEPVPVVAPQHRIIPAIHPRELRMRDRKWCGHAINEPCRCIRSR